MVKRLQCTDIDPDVRKSARAHNSVDYAKLTEGIVQTSDDTPEHHYINPIKSGEIEFTPETFPRMPAELITAEYFQKCRAMTEPVVIPAALNPRPQFPGSDEDAAPILDSVEEDSKMADAFIDTELPAERVSDIGQDGIGMVIPQGLTVRRVAELYGLHEKLAVIDVKSQEGEDKRWTLAKWADYYEDDSDDKPVRNVISLEVSRSRLGRLIKRPQVVRDLDLADSVWPTEDGPPPKVQFYVLMSVADCYTDFHIDFGGSSVYYHILKGKKTFFFIPPTTANLKHYENWCKSPAQNYCWLGNQTKECYRVDLSEGDTMLIPSGWIHAVWTPETSLVIGGNFLTRLHYTNQIKVAEIEKNTKVALKFRYPFFQKVMWSTVLQYLEQDPLPSYVEAVLMEGGQFPREKPIWQEYNKFGHNSDPGPEYYNARYYPQAELEGLPDLVSYIFRTVMIMLGRVEGVTAEAITAVTRSIPKRGNPLENARRFAMWVAWKRGNEQIPEWAHPDAVLPERPEAEDKAKKLSVAALKKLERAKHIEMYHTINADHRSRRSNNASRSGSPGSTNGARLPYASPKNSVLGPKRSACDACRKRRVGCKHKEAVRDASMVNGQRQFEFVAPSAKASVNGKDGVVDGIAIDPALEGIPGTPRALVTVEIPARVPPPAPLEPETPQETVSVTPSRPEPTVPTATPISAGGSRNKACANCRKSKVSFNPISCSAGTNSAPSANVSMTKMAISTLSRWRSRSSRVRLRRSGPTTPLARPAERGSNTSNHLQPRTCSKITSFTLTGRCQHIPSKWNLNCRLPSLL
ncbi:MAG: cupin-like domain-containing protein [Terriglobus roseus]|nr:cupin-like domain-containing protein [Terriglobus roseus]